MKRPYTRRAFTLIELLVVIAIMGILIALLLPAVHAGARSGQPLPSAPTIFKQIGLALHNYYDSFSYFPGYIDGNTVPTSTPDNNVGPGWGWASLLLPYLEQGNVYSQINFNVGVATGSNVAVSQITLPIFQCPSIRTSNSFHSTGGTPLIPPLPQAASSPQWRTATMSVVTAGRNVLTTPAGMRGRPGDNSFRCQG